MIGSLALVGAGCGGGEPQPAEPEAQEVEPAEPSPEPTEPVVEPEPEPAPEPEPEPLPKTPEYPVDSAGETLWDVVQTRFADDLGRSLSDERVGTLIDRGVCQVYSQDGRLRHFYQLDGTPVPGADPPSDRYPDRIREGIDTIVCDRERAEEILGSAP
jgi:hypothetical protein